MGLDVFLFFFEGVKFYCPTKQQKLTSGEICFEVPPDVQINEERNFFETVNSSFVLRFTDEISDLKAKRPYQQSHTLVGRFIVEL